ncbi:hypothetical protein [Niallia sp. 03190]
MKWWYDGIPIEDELNKKILEYEQKTGNDLSVLVIELLEKYFNENEQ